jgi:chemotaxis protein histidine kinase CheA
MGKDQDAEVIQPTSTLQDRVDIVGDGEMDFSAADGVVKNLAVEFINKLPEELQRIQSALTELIDQPEEETHKTVLFRLVHDLKGQAGTFDYNLISIIGNDLCRFLERPIPMTPRRLKVAGYYVEAMQVVEDKKITGDGDEFGIRMVDTLHSMTQKVLSEDEG